MKKEYKKPVLMLENMEFDSAIAGCNYGLTNPGTPQQTVDFGPLGIYMSAEPNCNLFASVCYHSPDWEEKGFYAS